MKKLLLCLSLLAVVSGCQIKKDSTPTTLTIYAYDSLTAEYGLLPKIIKSFEETNTIKINIVSFADTGSMLNQLIAEKNAPKADVVLGLDNVNLPTVLKENLFTPYQPQRAGDIAPDLRFDDQFTMTPFDYGYVGFVYDAQQLEFPEPISLAELAGPQYKDKIIIEQPGLSSPGTQLMLWSNAALGDTGADVFWRGMAANVLTVAPDWGTAYYTMFLNGEAPIVLSYLTSPAYHMDQEESVQFQAIPIKEGYIRQLEGVGVVAHLSLESTPQQMAARQFVDYLLTDEVQNEIPRTQWMFPIFGQPDQWPPAYQQIITPTPDQVLSVSPESLGQLDQWINEWNTTFKQ